MKKLFPVKKLSKESLLEFVDRKGFYIVLILCIAIVGTTAVFLTTRNINNLSSSEYDPGKIISEEYDPDDLEIAQEEFEFPNLATMESSTSLQSADAGEMEALEQESPSNEVAVNAPPPESVITSGEIGNEENDVGTAAEAKTEVKAEAKPKVETASADKSSTATNTATNTKPNTGNTTASTEVEQKAEAESFDMPIFGEVTQVFSNNKLIYSPTLEEWRVHTGTDISAERGTAVKAVAAGVITDVKNDPMYGITVIIEHPDDMKSVYCNLASDDIVVPNQKVEKGDIIGSVGNTAAFESLEQSHLHFEVWKNDVPVEPAEFLPRN